MIWAMSNRFDAQAREVADRHYNRQKPGTPQFVPPGRCLVLKTINDSGRAFWVTSWPFAEFVKHDWPGAWVCSAFRNEGAGIASEMIHEAVAATVAYYGEPPIHGMITFLDREKVRPTIVRGKKTWGWTWIKAGFRHVGYTRRRRNPLMAFQLSPADMPPPLPPGGFGDPHPDFRRRGALLRDVLFDAAVSL